MIRFSVSLLSDVFLLFTVYFSINGFSFWYNLPHLVAIIVAFPTPSGILDIKFLNPCHAFLILTFLGFSLFISSSIVSKSSITSSFSSSSNSSFIVLLNLF